MKVLFLDDDLERLKIAREFYKDHELTETTTVEQTIKMLEKYSPYDLVSLDHDLGGKIYVPSDEKSGYEVVKYIKNMSEDKLPRRVEIHSWNPVGSLNMYNLLTGVIPVTRIPFGRKSNFNYE